MTTRLLIPALVLLVAACATRTTVHENPDTGLVTWSAVDTGFSIELIQLVPDYVRAIYGSHNFPQSEIEDIAAYCVFGTIIKNTSEMFHVDVTRWIDAIG